MSNYSLHHKEKGQNLFTKEFVLVLFVVGILAAFHFFFPSVLSDTARFISAPLWKIKNSTTESFTSSVQLLASKKALVAENKNLKNKLEEVKFELLVAELLKQENIFLKELFNRQILDIENTVLGVVLARPSVSMYDTFVIDIGKDNGISKGENVLVFGDIFIGTIYEVYRSTSAVKLFSSSGEVSTVSIGQENISAEALGIGGGNFIVKLPRGVGVERGDIITMPDINARIFAVVEEIQSDPSDPFITVLFKNPVNMNEIKWVQVVTREKVVPRGGAE